MADRRLQLPEVVVPQRRLGRNINHDPRSLAYKVPRTATPTTVRWERRIPILDQGNLGRCVPTSAVGVMGTEPLFSLLPREVTDQLGDPLAVELYREVTRNDPYAGAWEPDDTGSDGLSMLQVLQAKGWVSGYEHITSIEAAWNAIRNGAFITGLVWMSGMDNPDGEGIVHADGVVRGGHEFVIDGVDAERELMEATNSWSVSWGLGGKFKIPFDDYSKLLAQQGDATTFVPPTDPKPEPQPLPDAQQVIDAFPFVDVDKWAGAKKKWWPKRDRTAAERYAAWRALVK